MRRASLVAAAISAAGPLALPPGAAAQPAVIGNVAAANQAVIGTPPAATQRQLQLGNAVNAEERIETADIGAGQFVFLDQTTLSVWPNSDIVLDRYVYDPERSVGEMSVTLTRGVLRFIGGRISKSADAEIRTPQGLVTVRGGIAQVSVTGGVTQVVHVAGEFTRLGDVVLSRPNALAEARVGPSGQVETRFVGVLDANGISALFGQQQGRGTGGLGAAPGDGQAGDMLVASGAQDRGSGDIEAAGSQPVSTLGEQQRDPKQERAPESPAVSDRQIAAGERVTDGDGVAPVEPPAVEPPVVTPPVVEPPVVTPPVVEPPVVTPPVVEPPAVEPPVVTPPLVEPPVVTPPVVTPPTNGLFAPPQETALSGLRGAGFDSGGGPRTLASGLVLSAPANQRVVFLDGDGAPFDTVTQLSYVDPVAAPPAGDTIELLFARNGPADVQQATDLLQSGVVLAMNAGQFALLPDSGTAGELVVLSGQLDGAPARVDFISDPGLFTLGAFAASGAIGLSVFGAPTPTTYWDQTTAASQLRVLDYQVSDALFTGFNAPLPEEVGDVVANGQGPDGAGLLLVSAAGGAFAGSSDKALAGLLSVEGSGAGQRSLLGVFAGDLERLGGGQLVIDLPVLLSARLGPQQGVDVVFGQLGSVAADGVTAFGPAGDYILLGGVTTEEVGGAAVSASRPNVFSPQVEPGTAAPIIFGDTRVAKLEVADVAPVGGRTPAGGASSSFSAIDQRITSVLRGGYAVAGGNATIPALPPGSAVSEPYLMVSADATSVRVGFAPDVNAVVAEISGLDGLGQHAPSGLQLNFGDLSGRGAMLNDTLFAARQTVGTQGALTFQGQQLSGSTGAAPQGGVQQAFAGGFVTSGLAGEGGLFTAGIDTQPEFLRWGWWNGEFAFAAAESDPALSGRLDRFHLGAWVSGDHSSFADVIAATGTASYDGFAVANVVERTSAGPVAYVEGGRFQMSYTFASSASVGAVSVSGILGQTFTGTVSALDASGVNHFGGGLGSAFDPNAEGGLQGSFFTGQGSPISAVGGAFSVSATAANGNAADAVGVFGADRTP